MAARAAPICGSDALQPSGFLIGERHRILAHRLDE
jgi:hypothetical protein